MKCFSIFAFYSSKMFRLRPDGLESLSSASFELRLNSSRLERMILNRHAWCHSRDKIKVCRQEGISIQCQRITFSVKPCNVFKWFRCSRPVGDKANRKSLANQGFTTRSTTILPTLFTMSDFSETLRLYFYHSNTWALNWRNLNQSPVRLLQHPWQPLFHNSNVRKFPH